MKNFLAVYTGNPNAPRPDMSQETIETGMAAWGAWGQTHADRIVVDGGPLGKTKKVSKAGVSDIRNQMAGFVVVKAESHEEAAALFEGHPHFTIFPGEGVEIMEVLPIPGT